MVSRLRVVKDSVLVALLLVTVGASLLVIAAELVWQDGEELYFSDDSFTAIQVVIQPGDTLWSLAEKYFSEADPRAVVWAIREHNQLSSATVYPGQVLQMPMSRDNSTLQFATAGL